MNTKKTNNFYAMLSRMKYINRWGLMRNTISENIAEHSLDVSIIAHALAVIGNTYFGKKLDSDRVAVLALFHDASEIITGDMPTPVKYFSRDIQDAYKSVEGVAVGELLDSIPEEMRGHYESILKKDPQEAELWVLVKAADKISALIKCVEEKGMGNSDFDSALKSTMDKIKEMNIKEADFFIENFIPAYSLTLDEQAR
ncbi:5'-deoxynucleotidase [Parasporobacterium paucivorans]|uniref:5'-deoxynucleotidase n=1 Tax=Parasporobacterium paucivorans DSM 15970 TaxID=1122934 RepID=A0A1M6G498_9FIRM|nr:5'-deoxynucleotidase [Parasporobacterium paucivorans]SHJ04821.1 5'-deoxynucleotidase [Parasporobacterium paucivorans DSM 15970]